MSAIARTRLPDRRLAVVETIAVDGHDYTVTAGIDPHTGAVRELFLCGAKSGSAMDAILGDAATVISVALQHGVAIEALSKSIARVGAAPPTHPEDLDRLGLPAIHRGHPASIIGGALDFLGHVMDDEDEG